MTIQIPLPCYTYDIGTMAHALANESFRREDVVRKSYVLDSSNSFVGEFSRCCREYKTLSIAVAWCGNPNQTLPYKHLENFKGTIRVIVGIGFNHTHPDGIEWFSKIGADIRIFNEDDDLFHPKIYLFRDQKRYALFIGSSNLTYGGFYKNYEANCLIEGTSLSGTSKDIDLLEETLAKWRTPTFSFIPNTKWLKSYRLRYVADKQKQRKQGIKTPPITEEEISTSSWLQYADWDIYCKKVSDGMKQRNENGQGYFDALDAADRELPMPWTTKYFKEIEKRRIMGGIEPYGSLGHVSASGRVRKLLASGTAKEWKTIVESINAIAQLEAPIPWPQLKSHLDRLIALGPTMKVWGRFLCIVRPDLYCTVAAITVRKNLSKTLGVPQNRFDRPEGYIQLIKLIHSSPWFNSKEPTNRTEAEVWRRRAALLDAIFY